MRVLRLLAIVGAVAMLTGCKVEKETNMGGQDAAAGTFSSDVDFLKKHTEVVILSDSTGQGKVAVTPVLQGRAMTSSAAGAGGLSYGWINRELIASGEFLEHINVFGGEDRFWIGPEGGQYSIFFKKDGEFVLDDWQTPAPIDTEPFELVSNTANSAILKKEMKLENYSGTQFSLRVDRQINVLERADAAKTLGVTPAESLKVVAFESINSMTNTGDAAWKKETGLLSIWILGMFNPSDATTIVVPFNKGDEQQLGKIVNDEYFGKVPAERLVVQGDNGVLFFSGDGQCRSKIGLTPQRAKSVLGSYDATNRVLTIVEYSKSDGVTDYVNSMWELQDAPYSGDAVNSYNDGPAKPGEKPLGPFYELETSSSAAELAAGATVSHTHRTIHLQGGESDLDAVSKAVLGVSTAQIKAALGG